MERVVALTLLCIALATSNAKSQTAQPPAKKTVAGRATHKPAAKSPPTARNSTHLATVSRSAHSSSTRTVRTRSGRIIRIAKATPAPSYQLHPDPERYQTIQKALADRGYFKGEPNGEWGGDSVDAMRHFQVDQKIDNDGKIDALSLISLGLGPRHDGTTASEPKLPPVAAPTTAPPTPALTTVPPAPVGVRPAAPSNSSVAIPPPPTAPVTPPPQG